MKASPQSEPSVLLDVRGIDSYYGTSQVLFGMSFVIRQREVVTLIGRNGMGKSTTVKTIIGMLRPMNGSIVLAGAEIAGQPSHTIASAGIGLVPEGRRIFPQLTVRENLLATARGGLGSDAWTLERVHTLFRLLILDEATEGLAPIVRAEIWACLAQLKAAGMSMIVIDKNIGSLLKLADRHYIVEKGKTVWNGGSAALRERSDLWEQYVGI
jgi:branched-chain amino acid transport system ATP-binding protein